MTEESSVATYRDETGGTLKRAFVRHFPLFVMAAIPYGGFLVMGGSAAFLGLALDDADTPDRVRDEAAVIMCFGAVMSLVHIAVFAAWVYL